MDRAVVLELDPGLRRLVEERQGQLALSLEHRHEPALDLRPEGFLLGVLLGVIGQRGVVQDAEPFEALDHLGAGLCAAVVGHDRARKTALENRLRQTVDRGLRRLDQIPLQVAEQARPVVDAPEDECARNF